MIISLKHICRMLHFRTFLQVCSFLKLVNFRLMINVSVWCGPRRIGSSWSGVGAMKCTIFGSGSGRGKRLRDITGLMLDNVILRSSQGAMLECRVRVPKTLPRRTPLK